MTTQEKLVRTLRERNMTVTTVESCTGGLISAALTDVAGSSEVFRRGFVTYCDEAKHEMVGVRSETLKQYTAVSRQTAQEMAEGGAAAAQADCCVSVTGYAGPDTGLGEPVGLVYIGCFVEGRTVVEEHHFSGGRSKVRAQAAARGLSLLLQLLHNGAEPVDFPDFLR